jgi:hypothetical protein
MLTAIVYDHLRLDGLLLSSLPTGGAKHLPVSAHRPILKLPLAVVFLAALLLWPVVGVSRPLPGNFLTHPELTVYALCFFTACVGYWPAVASLFAFDKQNLTGRLHVLGWCVYLSLFITSCLLCRRLKVCIIHIHNISAAVGAWLGPPLVIAGTFLILSALAEKNRKKPALLAYPQHLGLLLIIAGVSIAHWAWFPLLALPGIFIVEAWYIKREEASKAVAAAEKTDGSIPTARFRIIPFIY